MFGPYAQPQVRRVRRNPRSFWGAHLGVQNRNPLGPGMLVGGMVRGRLRLGAGGAPRRRDHPQQRGNHIGVELSPRVLAQLGDGG